MEKICSVPGCLREYHSKGMCHMHARRVRNRLPIHREFPEDWGDRTKNPLWGKWCWIKRSAPNALCSEWLDFKVFEKELPEAPEGYNYLRRMDRTIPMGPGNAVWTKQRYRSPVGQTPAEYQKEHRARTKLTGWRAYGIDDVRYHEILDAQNGVCAICGRPETAVDKKNGRTRRLAIDHDHATGKVRGLLCTKCNAVLGYAQDSFNVLLSSIQYLRRHRASED